LLFDEYALNACLKFDQFMRFRGRLILDFESVFITTYFNWFIMFW